MCATGEYALQQLHAHKDRSTDPVRLIAFTTLPQLHSPLVSFLFIFPSLLCINNDRTSRKNPRLTPGNMHGNSADYCAVFTVLAAKVSVAARFRSVLGPCSDSVRRFLARSFDVAMSSNNVRHKVVVFLRSDRTTNGCFSPFFSPSQTTQQYPDESLGQPGGR